MILVISSLDDHSTLDVLYWLKDLGKSYLLITPETKVKLIELRIDSFELEVLGNKSLSTISSRDITSVWYRRGMIRLDYSFNGSKNDSISNHLINEHDKLVNCIYNIIGNRFTINDPRNINLNKIEVLFLADKFGIDTPKSFIAATKVSVEEFMKKETGITLISKSINEAPRLSFKSQDCEEVYLGYTSQVDTSKMTDSFFPSLFQECIEKQFEIRTTFLFDKFYSMAIFSQNDDKTKVDFRNYNWRKPNRSVPYKLPKRIEYKLRELMKFLELKSGSLDIIYGTDKKYYFLEINPVGQFGMVSEPCNYNLHKVIAENLD